MVLGHGSMPRTGRFCEGGAHAHPHGSLVRGSTFGGISCMGLVDWGYTLCFVGVVVAYVPRSCAPSLVSSVSRRDIQDHISSGCITPTVMCIDIRCGVTI